MLPERWCVKVTNANKEILGKWRTDGSLGTTDYDKVLATPYFLHTPKYEKRGYNKIGISPGYLEISFDDFRRYVLEEDIPPLPKENMKYLEKLLKRWNIR